MAMTPRTLWRNKSIVVFVEVHYLVKIIVSDEPPRRVLFLRCTKDVEAEPKRRVDKIQFLYL